jgi:hypothetical protein
MTTETEKSKFGWRCKCLAKTSFVFNYCDCQLAYQQGRKDERQKVLKEVKAWAESHIKEKPHRMYSWLSDVVRYCNEALAKKEGDEK